MVLFVPPLAYLCCVFARKTAHVGYKMELF